MGGCGRTGCASERVLQEGDLRCSAYAGCMLWLSSMFALVFTLGSLLLAVWALIDSATRKPAAFPAVDRQTKQAWLIINGLCVVVLLWFGVVSFLGLPAVAVAIYYLVDVRPKVASITRGSRW